MNHYHVTLEISKAESEVIDRYLAAMDDEDYQGEDATIRHTAVFPDGKQMDIKCCGCQDEPSWTEAVLFDNHGFELCCSDVCDEYLGDWELEYAGVTYSVTVAIEGLRNNQ